MSHVFSLKSAQRGLLFFIHLSLLTLVLTAQAQGTDPTNNPQQSPLATEIPVSDPLPPEAPTEVLPVEIPVLPTQEITLTPIEVTPVFTQEAPIATQDVIALPTEDATSVPTSEVAPIEPT